MGSEWRSRKYNCVKGVLKATFGPYFSCAFMLRGQGLVIRCAEFSNRVEGSEPSSSGVRQHARLTGVPKQAGGFLGTQGCVARTGGKQEEEDDRSLLGIL